MLKHIKVWNYLSFWKLTEVNFESSKYWKKEWNVFSVWKTVLSKSLLIYWANASWKSNILRTVVVIKNFALNFLNPIITPPFLLDNKYNNKPSFFEICFFVDDKEYIYNFELTWGKVVSENLSEFKNKKPIKLFSRNLQTIVFENEFKTYKWQIEDKVKDTASLLWVLDQFNAQLNNKPISYFFNKLHSLWDWFSPENTVDKLSLLNSDKNKKFVLEFLKCADINICDIQVEKEVKSVMQIDFIKKSFMESSEQEFNIVRLWHKIKWSDKIEYFPLSNESTWTIKLFWIIWMIVETITKEWILFFDEIENHLHPHIVKNLIELIHFGIYNKYQFVFTTHNIDLMDLSLFKKEQIWITKRDELWNTSFETLDKYDIRSENDLKKMYNNWVFWWIPNIKDFSTLLKDFKLSENI